MSVTSGRPLSGFVARKYDVQRLKGRMYMQREAAPRHFTVGGHGKRLVSVIVEDHEMYVTDSTDDELRAASGTAAHYLHAISVPNCAGGPVPFDAKMFWLDTLPWQDQTGQHHEAHHLFFVAGSEAGRDEWVDLLVERGMFRAKYTEEHSHSMGHHHHCMGCERTHTADIAPTCEDSHPLQRKVLSSAQSCDCNYCGALIGAKDVVFRCHVCDFDLCFDCHKEDTLRLQIEDLKERERAARLTEHDAYMNAQDKIAASHDHAQVTGVDVIMEVEMQRERALVAKIQRARLAAKVLEESVREKSRESDVPSGPPHGQLREEGVMAASTQLLQESISSMKLTQQQANADLERLLDQASERVQTLSHGFGGEVPKNLMQPESASHNLTASSSMGSDSVGDEEDAHEHSQAGDAERDTAAQVNLAVAHVLHVDVAVEAEGAVCLQHTESDRRLHVGDVSWAKALHVLSVCQTESRQMLVGTGQRPAKVGLRVSLSGHDSSRHLDAYHANLGTGQVGSIVGVSPDGKRSQVLWPGGVAAWYSTGEVREYGELGFRLSRLSADALEVSQIYIDAENMDGQRFSDTRELVAGDKVVGIDGVPVSKMPGDIARHFRESISVGPIDSEVVLDCLDGDIEDGTHYQVHCKRRQFGRSEHEEEHLAKLDMHPMGMYHLQKAGAVGGASWSDTTWRSFKETGVVMRHTKVEVFRRSSPAAALSEGLEGADLLNALHAETPQFATDQAAGTPAVDADEQWLRVQVGKRVIVETPVNELGEAFFSLLRNEAKHAHSVHGMLKSSSTQEQVQALLSDVLNNDDEVGEEAKLEAERRLERAEVTATADQLQQSAGVDKHLEATRLKLKLLYSNAEKRPAPIMEGGVGEVLGGILEEIPFTIDRLLDTFGVNKQKEVKETNHLAKLQRKGWEARIGRMVAELELEPGPLRTTQRLKVLAPVDQLNLLHRIKSGRIVQRFDRKPFADHPAMHRAILTNDTDTLIKLLDHGSKPEQGSNVADQLSAFQVAVLTGNLDAVRVMLQAGADVDFCFQPHLLRHRQILGVELQAMTKIQQKIDVNLIKIKDLEDAGESENPKLKSDIARLRQQQLMHQEVARKALDQKHTDEAFQKKLNARAPIALACFSKQPAMVHELLLQNAECEIGLPSIEAVGVHAAPMTLLQWCSQHFLLGAAQLTKTVPSMLQPFVSQPLFGVFCTWVHHVHHRRELPAGPDSEAPDELEGFKVEMTLEELVLGLQRFGLWPAEASLKKLAVLGVCAEGSDPVSDNGLPTIFLQSLHYLVSKKAAATDERRAAASGLEMAGGEDDDEEELTWHRFQRVFQRKVEKLFFSALQLENGVGGADGAYALRDKKRLQALVAEAEKEFRLLQAIKVLQLVGTERSMKDIRKVLRNNKLGLKCLDLTDDAMDVLEADLLAIAHEEGDSLIRVRRSRIAQHKDGSTDPAEINFFSCPVDPTRDTVPEQLTIDFPQFQWIIEVLCRENLADMSMGEFARLVLLDKAVDLKVEDQAPEAFRNLQNSSAHHHHHDRHHKRSHAQPPKVAATLLSGDLWAELVSEDALTRPRRHGLRGASSTQFSSTVQSKSSASRASDSVTAADHTLKPELNLDNPNLIQMRLGVASMLKSANVQSQVHIPYGPDDRSEGATASLPATASKPGDEKKSSVASNSRAAGGNLMTAQQRLNARMQKYEAARSARQVLLAKACGPATVVRDKSLEAGAVHKLQLSTAVFQHTDRQVRRHDEATSVAAGPSVIQSRAAGGGWTAAKLGVGGQDDEPAETSEFLRDRNMSERAFDDNSYLTYVHRLMGTEDEKEVSGTQSKKLDNFWHRYLSKWDHVLNSDHADPRKGDHLKYGGLDGKTQEDAIDLTTWLPTLNVFNNYGTITSDAQAKSQRHLWG